MSRAEYATRQRRAVYDYFLNHKDGCYTAKEITESGETGASAATIYRILAYLTEKGTLDKYSVVIPELTMKPCSRSIWRTTSPICSQFICMSFPHSRHFRWKCSPEVQLLRR